MSCLRRLSPSDVRRLDRRPVPAEVLARAAEMLATIEREGESAVRRFAEQFDGLESGAPLWIGPEALRAAYEQLDAEEQALLERTATRIRRFAEAQRGCLAELDIAIEGGRAGHRVAPVDSAGCYAPGGRYPLPSSVLMTAIAARAAGVRQVVVASPQPGRWTCAAAHVAGADGLLPIGGVQAIAALALGLGCPRADVIAGPGSAWVTAAKQLMVGRVGIDMLAGPSELVVVADDSASPAIVAADLLAQAEHDPLALPVLISTSAPWIDRVEQELMRQLTELSTADIARQALACGFAVHCADLVQAAAVSDTLAPEHLQLMVAEPQRHKSLFRHYGGLFIGARSAEVLGDYGAGPNHVLPTGASARHTGGLSVMTFLRVTTWLDLDSGAEAHALARDAAALAHVEGLSAHARAAEMRL